MTKQLSNQKPAHLEAKGQVDLLFQAVSSYSKCKEFKSLLQFCAKFKQLSPYNAMLVQMQRPTATYVLSADEWKRRYNRIIKPNAWPLMILVPFGPVYFVFDIEDTEPVEKIFPDDMEALWALINENEERKKTTCETSLAYLTGNLSTHGIAFDRNLLGGDELGAQIEVVKQKKNIHVALNKKSRLRWDSYFLLSVNDQQDDKIRFSAICKELGHLFCHHIQGYNWWNYRGGDLDHNTVTFEAETVAWLVCERQGIENPATSYLTNYFQHHKKVPEVSLDFILQAANEIEKMLKPMNYQKGLLYKKDDKFREAVRKSKEHQQVQEVKEPEILSIYRQGELF